jgi:hypothetical protein
LGKSWALGIKKWFWAYSSFLGPLGFYRLIMGNSLYVSLRAGLLGLSVAGLIYLLWKVSLRIYGIVLPEKYGDLCILFSALLLWSVWFTVGQIILVAYDELTVH